MRFAVPLLACLTVMMVASRRVPATPSAPSESSATLGSPPSVLTEVDSSLRRPRPTSAGKEKLLPGERQFNECLRLSTGHLRVTFKPETDITDVIAWIASATCKGFIVAQGLQLTGRKVMVFSPEWLTAAEAYRLFLSLLETAGLTVEPSGRFLRIIEANKSARAVLPILGETETPDRDDAFITRLVRVRHANVNELTAVLQGYRSESGQVVPHPPTGTLILTDRAAKLDHLVALISALDVPGEELRLWTLPARHLSAVDLAQTLSELTGSPLGAAGGRKPGAGPTPVTASPAGSAAPANGVARLQPDDRAGRLLVVATEAAFARLAALAAKLDVPAETRAAKVHAYRCRHADCDAVASILATLADINVARGPSPEGTRRPGPTAMPGAAPPPPSAFGSPGRNGAPPLFAGEVRVTSDPSTNALLVLSSLDDFRALRRLIEEIDVPRKQVFIEATIMEVVRRKDRQVGVAFHGGSPAGTRGAVVGGFNAGETLLLDQNSLGAALVGLSGLAVGAPLDGVARALGITSRQVPSLGAFIQLLQEDDNVDLIANPHLLITNNHEGEISVGQRVPVQGAFTGALNGSPISGVLPTVSVNREDVALTLKLTPHVNEEGLIRLEIDQEMSELGPNTGPLGPSTTRRTTRTMVYARDQQTIVIGGLQRDRQSEGSQKVPILGDIPVLGFLFRSTRKIVEKQNIIVALTPYVIDQAADLTRVLEAKLRDRREFVRLYGTAEERRLLLGPLGMPNTPGMLEHIHRAVTEIDKANPPPVPASGSAQTEGLPLPDSASRSM